MLRLEYARLLITTLNDATEFFSLHPGVLEYFWERDRDRERKRMQNAMSEWCKIAATKKKYNQRWWNGCVSW